MIGRDQGRTGRARAPLGRADWLPNPLSRAPGEPEGTQRLLGEAGLAARLERRGRMVGVVGDLR